MRFTEKSIFHSMGVKIMSSNKNDAKTSDIKKILSRLSRYKLFIALSFIFAIAIVVLTLYIPIIIGRGIDLIIGKGNVDFPRLVRLLAGAGIVAVVTSILQWLMNTINNHVTYGVVRDIREEAFKKLEILPLSYIDSHSSGDIVSRIISDVDTFADGLLMGFTQFFTGVLTILGTLLFMLSLNYKITILVVCLTPLSLFFAAFIARHTYDMFAVQSKTRGEQTAFIDEMIQNQKVVIAFSHEDDAKQGFDSINERLEKYSLKAIFYSSLTNPCTRFVNSIVYAFVALTGAIAAINGNITVGGLSCFLSYANQYTKPFNEISGVVTELQNAIACAGRIFEFIEEEPQIPDAEGAIVLNNARGDVSLSNVCFSYTANKKLIENLSLDVEIGKRVAIVGPTGCGKTTLINLLMRFYDVTGGKITVDSTDIRDITRDSLRKSFGMVLQDTWLKSGTIRDNIVMGKPDATDEEVINAAKLSHSHSFIKRLPDGYNTLIGEDGGNLSQGQKQLLCITRVMLCLPPMLILDEATSSIDTRTEIKIQKAFAELMKNKTSFIVAHRLSTIKEADIILVMKDGNVVEKGTHSELLKANGFYSHIYNSQFEH